MQAALDKLSSLFSQKGLKPLLLGGYALQAFGVFRQTMDVDCLIDENSAQDIDLTLRETGYEVKIKTGTFARYIHPDPTYPDFDILFVDAATFSGLTGDSQLFSLNDSWWRVPSLSHMIALKLHAIRCNPRRKARDTADIVDLIGANPEAISRDDLRLLCEQYGPPEYFAEFEKWR